MEMSARTASLALSADGTVRALAAWDQGARPHPQLFATLPGLFKDAGLTPSEVSEFVVGLGPGSFSGTRIALAAANGLALPGGAPVRGLPSCAALAWEALATQPERTVVVLGDARRERCWLSRYRRAADRLEALQEPALYAMGAVSQEIGSGDLVLTPDWERLAPYLAATVPPGAELVREARSPSAVVLSELAEQVTRLQRPFHPPQPIYLHPPV